MRSIVASRSGTTRPSRWKPQVAKPCGLAHPRCRFLPFEQVDRAAFERTRAEQDPRVPARPIEPERGARLRVVGGRLHALGQSEAVPVETAGSIEIRAVDVDVEDATVGERHAMCDDAAALGQARLFRTGAAEGASVARTPPRRRFANNVVPNFGRRGRSSINWAIRPIARLNAISSSARSRRFSTLSGQAPAGSELAVPLALRSDSSAALSTFQSWVLWTNPLPHEYEASPKTLA